MVLDNQTIEKIKSLVYSKPRSVNQVAEAIGKNWRTANKYIEEIMLKTGEIKTMIFREGTRGALKVVYWNNTEKIYSSDIQEKIFKQIESGIDKTDFSPFEIYQYVDSEKRTAIYEKAKAEATYDYRVKDLIPYFEKTEKEICIFAGNLAFINLNYKDKTLFNYLEECVKKKVSIKILTKINLVDLDNIEKVLSLNTGLKEPLVEVRHTLSPLRAYIFDDDILRMGEVQITSNKQNQSKENLAIYYEIRDKEWISWMKKVFWKKFQNAVKSSFRIENINTIKSVKN